MSISFVSQAYHLDNIKKLFACDENVKYIIIIIIMMSNNRKYKGWYAAAQKTIYKIIIYVLKKGDYVHWMRGENDYKTSTLGIQVGRAVSRKQ